MIKAVVFDVDGVIVVNEKLFSDYYCDKYNVAYEDILPFYVGPFQKCLVGITDLRELLQTEIARFEWKDSVDGFMNLWFKTEDNVDENVLKFIDEIKRAGLVVAIATNQEKYRTQYIVEDMGIGKHFHHIFSSAHIGHMKPSRDFFAHVQKSLKVKPEEILFFDDSEKNVKGARDFGINAEHYTDLKSCKNTVKKYQLFNN